MILRIELEQFPAAVRRVLSAEDAWLIAVGGFTVVTAGDPARRLLVVARSTSPIEDAKLALQKAGLEVHEGEWSLDEDTSAPQHLYIAAVSYISREPQPGLWVDAYDAQPTTAQVLKAMYEEFNATGELGGASFEEFVRLANPNVVIVSPAQLDGYAAEKRECG